MQKEWATRFPIVTYDAPTAGALQKSKDQGISFTELSPQERGKFEALVLPVWDAWVADKNGKKLPGTDAMNTYKELLKKVPEWRP